MKRVRTKHRKVSVAIGALIVAGLLGFTAVGALAATTFFNGFDTNTTGWNNYGGTITQVSSPSTWPNNYGGNLSAATGSGYARLGIDPAPGTVSCAATNNLPVNSYSGPYTYFGGAETTFPTGGYSTSVDVYFDVAYGMDNPDARFDWSSAINNANVGTRDFVFNVSATPLGFVVDGTNNSNRCGANPNASLTAVPVIQSGWYTMKHTFTGVSGGVLSVQMDLIRLSDNAVVGTWTRSDPTDIIGSVVGGHSYGWFVQNEFDGLAIDNSRLAPLTPPPPSADLSVTKTDSPDPVHIGQKLTYTIPVVNNGPDTATGVTLTDSIPKSTGFGSASASNGGTCTRSKTTVTCSLGTMTSSQTVTVTIVVKPTKKGTISNTVNVSATSPTDPNLLNNEATQDTLVKP
jgi:uncharacterized repeat protein (TIGR01451 family)